MSGALPHRPLRIGFIGFGEVASHVLPGLRDAGLTDIAVYARRPEARDRAAGLGAAASSDIAALADRDVVLACVPGSAAVDAARSAAALPSTLLYVDVSSLDPAGKRAAAEAAPGVFVDAAILGSAVERGHRVPLVASGPGAARFAGLFAPHGMVIEVVGDRPGEAAAIKLVRSVFVKGLEALYAEAFVAARRLGVLDTVEASVAEFLDARPARDTADMLLRSHLLHAARRAEECALSARLVADAGLDPLLSAATAALMARTAARVPQEKVRGRPGVAQAVALLDESLGDNP
ncbi:3-hydroxyisobutyrate dehydrogenase-like beta-hydroxyacid dehydrogenase [Azospirillum agricola]|uniref:NAD(P)-dependent oxidoreductase n=1 Tax=Azospirillum agricola TaxID=1720247 RepID=UPI001AE4FD6A|nr:DUF1932 domain-containing protein [Azospirillum agricola]MBP2228646.1 3-hydroxyisobutyrate dehydrogenase-like beta-hydroxyacid dehydrogenase [Azospirillum agricola]